MDNPVEDTKRKVEAQILELQQQQNTLEYRKIDVALYLDQYHAEKSHFGHIAQWYGEESWLLKIIIATSLTGILIIFYVPLIVSLFLSLIASFLLENHYQFSQKQNILIAQDLEAQNTAIQESIELLQGVRQKMSEALLLICQTNLTLLENNSTLRTQLTVLSQKIIEYELSIEQLKDKNNKSIQLLDCMQTAGERASEVIGSLKKTNHGLSETADNCKAASDALKTMCLDMSNLFKQDENTPNITKTESETPAIQGFSARGSIG